VRRFTHALSMIGKAIPHFLAVNRRPHASNARQDYRGGGTFMNLRDHGQNRGTEPMEEHEINQSNLQGDGAVGMAGIKGKTI